MNISRTTALIRKAVPGALRLLAQAEGKQLRIRDLLDQMDAAVPFAEWDRERGPSGDFRWRKIFNWYSLGMVDAGLIVKKSGIWYLTPIGESSIDLSPEEILRRMDEAYWSKRGKTEPAQKEESKEGQIVESVGDSTALELDQAVAQASDRLRAHMDSMGPWEVQQIVAGLLRAMGYYTPFVAPEHQKDGGLDVLAYRDPLGATGGRVKVQVKHRPESKDKASREEIQRLASMVQSDSQEIGLFVSTYGFSQPAKDFARDTKQHIELWDGERLLDGWREFYSKLDEKSRALMRLRPVYFLELDRAAPEQV